MVEVKTKYLSEGEITAKTEEWNKIIENNSPLSNDDLYCLVRDIIKIRAVAELNPAMRVSHFATSDFEFILNSTRLEEDDFSIGDLTKQSLIFVINKKTSLREWCYFTQPDPSKSLSSPKVQKEISYESAFGLKGTLREEVQLDGFERKQIAKTIWQAHLEDRAPMTETK